MTEAILFDMDSVLADSELFNTLVQNRHFDLNGISISDVEHINYMESASEMMRKKNQAKYKPDKFSDQPEQRMIG